MPSWRFTWKRIDEFDEAVIRNFLVCRNRVAVVRIAALVIAAVSLLASTQSGLANTRDTVMSRAFACGVVGEPRMWLDCFYGAAQSIRLSLGLQPATPAQEALAAHPPVGAVTNDEAKLRENILYTVMGCRVLENDRDWLRCYYGAAQPMRAQLGLQPDPVAQPSIQPAERGKGPPPAPVGPVSQRAPVVSRMISYSFDRYGIFTVHLENGQTWYQLPGDTSFAKWEGAPNKYLVRITRGIWGSVNLEVDHSPGMFKVRQVE